MTTMRRWSAGLAIVSAALLTGVLAFADDAPKKEGPAGAPPQTKGIADVTTGDGRHIPLEQFAAPPNTAHTDGLAKAAQRVVRGQAWWPYASPMPPYNPMGKRVEAMSEDEISVNGIASLNVRDVQGSLAALPKELLIEPGAQLKELEGFYLVKLRGFSRTQEQVDALTRAGAILGEYININTYIAKIPSSDFAAVKALPFVTFVGDYQPAYKISPRIGLEEVPVSEALDASGHEKPWALELQLHKGVYLQDVLSALARIGIFPHDDEIVATDALTVVQLRSLPAAIPAMATIPGVKWVAEKSYPELNASASNPAAIPMILQNNGVYTSTSAGWRLWNAGIDGGATGQIVTMMDTGLNTKMYHFSQDTLNTGTIGPAHRKVVAYENFGGDLCVLGNADVDGGHGAKTSQHAVGSISNMITNPDTMHVPNANWDDGIARGAKVYMQDIGDATGSINPPLDLGPSITAAIMKGSFVQNHSWGNSSDTYDSLASLLDTALFNNPNFVVTTSAGNRGAIGAQTLGNPATAKNSITVGGNDAANPDDLFIDCGWDGLAGCSTGDLGSSRGPVSGSGRYKPDIMSFIWASVPVGGEQMAYDAPTAMCQTDATKTPYMNYINIGNEGGTSFAAPDIAGLAALVRDYFQQGFYPTGTATPANAITPSGALVKAVILASGEDMAATSFPSSSPIIKRYSGDVGYGRANLPAALHIGGTAPYLWVQNSDLLGDGATKTFQFNINSSTIPLRVMLAYYDAAGDALQKDVDLKVTVGGHVYWGNNFSGGWSTFSTATRDHTNPTEGVFLDAAHGLPSSGTVQVDVVGVNDPGGMNYSLVLAGDVVSQNVTQVTLDKAKYTCNALVTVTVNDSSATSPVSVTLVSKNSSSTTIDTQIVSCSGSNGVFVGTIQLGSGLIVADGGSITASYTGALPATSTIACQISGLDEGLILKGGCDDSAAGTDPANGPLFNGGVNEFYTQYMDAGEYSSYTFKFQNSLATPIHDATVNLSFSGGAASKMSVLNNPVHIGFVPAGATVGAVFQLFTDLTAAALTSVNLDFDVTSPSDGYTTPKRFTQPQILQANNVVQRLAQCQTFNTSLGTFLESTAVSHSPTPGALNTFRWSGAATTPTLVKSEVRTDTLCGSSVPNAAAMTGNSGTTANFVNFADSFLFTRFQPALRGSSPSGQPYQYAWKWHSFYHASETGGNQGGVWGAFYNDGWNLPSDPTGDEMTQFPISLAYFYQNVFFDYPSSGSGSWDWEVANTGTPDDPHLGPSSGGAPNQWIITFPDSVRGPANSNTWWVYGHQHADVWWFTSAPQTHGTHRDIALDNDRLVYDEFYAQGQVGTCSAASQPGLVAFDQFSYDNCPTGTAVLSVTDANGVTGLTVTVTSPGTGDSEVVTLTGSAPYFSGTLTLSTTSGVGANNGVLFVLPSETISATYTDSSPAGSTTAVANVGCTGGDVVYLSNAQVSDNGDNDGFADNNETVTMDLTIQNNLTTALTNAKVQIFADSPNIDCISDATALYGTVGPGSNATNPPGDRFTFHVKSTVACTDPLNPPTARFIVAISGDGLDGAATLQKFLIPLDLNPTASGGAYTYTQNFSTDPGWATGITPDDDLNGSCPAYVNDFHWCAACGNGGGGYGAWVGNSPFGTSGQNYSPDYNSSTLYSPPWVANGNVTMQFRIAYRVEFSGPSLYDGAILQSKVGAGNWTAVSFITPPQAATVSQDFCSPLAVGQVAWTGNGPVAPYWTLTNQATITASSGQSIQFRWRLGGDQSGNGAGFGGLGVDDVTVTNLKQTTTCEPTRNNALPSCPFCLANPNGTPCDDSNGCTINDACTAGACAGTPITVPPETANLRVQPDKTSFIWDPMPNTPAYDVVRGTLSALPVGPGGGDESCFNDLVAAVLSDGTVPSPGTGFWYLSRAENTCGIGTFGTQGLHGAPGAPRVTTTCP